MGFEHRYFPLSFRFFPAFSFFPYPKSSKKFFNPVKPPQPLRVPLFAQLCLFTFFLSFSEKKKQSKNKLTKDKENN